MEEEAGEGTAPGTKTVETNTHRLTLQSDVVLFYFACFYRYVVFVLFGA